MPDLKIARDLALPTSAATQTFAILAQRRKGKTYTASVIAEEMVGAGMPWVALDPTGAWWGLRAGKDGKRKGGLPVYVFGGDHGDLPLDRAAGAQIADLVVENPRWYVLDLSHFESKAAEREFATAFAERFYRRKGKSKAPMHLFVDEADIFVPQRVPSGDQRMLGAFEAIVRRGGIRGIGTTLISQRAAVVNKNVLEQLDALIILRVLGPNDQKAIKGYVDAYGSEAELKEIMGSLASLDLGEAWYWEPGADVFQRIHVRERHTFNSSATPDGKGQGAVDLAEIDLDALRGKLDSAIEKAKADDPKALRKRIAELERELKKRPTEKETVEVEKEVEVEKLVLAEPLVEMVNRLVTAIRVQGKDRIIEADALGAELDKLREGFDVVPVGRTQDVAQRRASRPRGVPRSDPATTSQRSSVDRDAVRNAEPNGEIKLGKAERALLGVIAQFPEGRTKVQTSILSGYSAKSSSFTKAIGRLRSLELISPAGQDPIIATPAGVAMVPDAEPVPTGDELLQHWLGRLGKAERVLLRAFADAWREGVQLDKESLSEVSATYHEAPEGGYSATSSSFTKALGRLRTLDLVRGFEVNSDLMEVD